MLMGMCVCESVHACLCTWVHVRACVCVYVCEAVQGPFKSSPFLTPEITVVVQ